jgi:hypothetical protein
MKLLRRTIFACVALMVSSVVQAGDAIVSWDYPTTYEDTTPLAPSAILGVVIYYGNTTGGPYPYSKVVAAPALTSTITNLAACNWYFVATVMATNNLESVYSNEVLKSVASTSKPRKPTLR